MQDGFLFDDDDPKQRGVDCDALCADDKRLKFKWTWTRYKGRMTTPGQCTKAELENGWSLETVFWHRDYEARVNRYGNGVESTFREKPPLVTRLDAQLKAEELFVELGKDIVRQCEKLVEG